MNCVIFQNYIIVNYMSIFDECCNIGGGRLAL